MERNIAESNLQEEAQASFVVEIKCCKNNTWQGTVSWVEKQKKQSFRSALELIKLMDSAIESQKNARKKVSFEHEEDSENM